MKHWGVRVNQAIWYCGLRLFSVVPPAGAVAQETDLPLLFGKYGKYELAGQVGEGIYTKVFKGVDRKRGCEVAIKTIKDEFLSDPSIAGRLQRAYDVMRFFKARDVPRAMDYFELSGQPYL